MIKSFLFCFTRHRTNKTRISFLPGLLVYLTLPRILLLYPFKIYESFPRLLNMLATVRDDALTHRHSWAQLLLKKPLSERKWRFLYNYYEYYTGRQVLHVQLRVKSHYCGSPLMLQETEGRRVLLPRLSRIVPSTPSLMDTLAIEWEMVCKSSITSLRIKCMLVQWRLQWRSMPGSFFGSIGCIDLNAPNCTIVVESLYTTEYSHRQSLPAALKMSMNG